MQQVPYRAPDFSLEDSGGKKHTLADYSGKWVILYFYPEDETPGCTVEACEMRDARDDLTDLGAIVIGVSRDSATSHEKFKAKYSLNFTLLCDPTREVHNLYGAWGKKMFGREDALRKTFIIDPGGMVRKVFGRVTPLGHGEKVTAELRKMIQ